MREGRDMKEEKRNEQEQVLEERHRNFRFSRIVGRETEWWNEGEIEVCMLP